MISKTISKTRRMKMVGSDSSETTRFVSTKVLAIAIVGAFCLSGMTMFIQNATLSPRSAFLGEVNDNDKTVGASIADATVDATWTTLSWSSLNTTVTKYTRGGTIGHTEMVLGDGSLNVSIAPVATQRSVVFALPTNYTIHDGISIKFSIRYWNVNEVTTTNYGQQFGWGFVRGDTWDTTKNLINAVGSYTHNKTGIWVEQCYRTAAYAVQSFGSPGLLESIGPSGTWTPAATAGKIPLGSNATSQYQIYAYAGTTVQDRRYFGTQVWNLSAGEDYVYGDYVLKKGNNSISRATPWRMLFEWYNPIAILSTNYYNMTISPISICTDFGRDEMPSAWQQDASWVNHSSYQYVDPFYSSGTTGDPSIIWTPSGYIMSYFIAHGSTYNLQFARATTLPQWTWWSNYSYVINNPIKPDLCYLPNGTYALWHNNPGGISYSWSPDLITWTQPYEVIPENYAYHTSIHAASILKDLITGTPFKINDRYWMAYNSANDSGNSEYYGQVGIAYSSDLETWTEYDEAIFTPDKGTSPSSWLIWWAGSPNLFAWNGSVYLLINAHNDKPTYALWETGHFGNFIAKATNIDNYVGTDMYNWTLTPEPIFTRSNLNTYVDGTEFFTGDFALQLNGNLSYYYNGMSTSYSGERITYVHQLTGALPTEVISTLRTGWNRILPNAQNVAWDWSGEPTTITATSDAWLNISVTDYDLSTDVLASWEQTDIADVVYTLTGLDPSMGYCVYQDGDVIATGIGPSISFTATGGGEFEVEVWNTKTVSAMIVLTVNMVGLGILVTVIAGWVIPFSRAINKGRYTNANQMMKELMRGFIFIVVALIMWVMLHNVAIG